MPLLPSDFQVKQLVYLTQKRCYLLIFYTSQRAYQYRIVSENGDVFVKTEIFYTENAAMVAGLKFLGLTD